MKKTKKNMKKNSYIGKNVYGQSCIIKEVTLERETALAQYLEIMTDIENHKKANQNIEYSIAFSKDMSKQEIDKFYDDLKKMMTLRCQMNNTKFVELPKKAC